MAERGLISSDWTGCTYRAGFCAARYADNPDHLYEVDEPIATYECLGRQRLTDYLTGLTGRKASLQTVEVRYATRQTMLGGDQRIQDAPQLAKKDAEGNLFAGADIFE